MKTTRLRLGISACLLGQNVRYDGGHKLDRNLVDTLSPFVDWVPVCPEVECGLPVPREAMRLVGAVDRPRLVTRQTRVDLTERMTAWATCRVAELAKEQLGGFIFKSDSPSSGLFHVRVYNETGMPTRKGTGLFARVFTEAFPRIPAEDDGRLRNAEIRENFFERVFVYRRWETFMTDGPSVRGLIAFHADHKLLIMAHSPSMANQLGHLTSEPGAMPLTALCDRYTELLFRALALSATVKKNTNVLQHIMGYFKRDLSADEKQELLDVIDLYHTGRYPLIVPVTLLRHYVRKYDIAYLKRQYYLHPHPDELMLRNHS